MRQRGDIHANAYSAMKEDEHLMRLKVFSDMRDPGNRRQFIYHPFVSDTEVTESPFDFMYVLDTNPEVHLKDFKISAADAIYLQLFSPIFSVRNSDYDNYEKNQKRLARGLYSTFYGSYGCSVLVLPDKDLLKYCCQRKTADVIRKFLSSNLVLPLSSGPENYVPKTEELELLDPEAQVRLWDDKFAAYMRDRVVRLEGTPANQASDPDTLGPYGQELYYKGFGIGLGLPELRKKIDKLSSEGMKDADKKLLHRLVLPAKLDPEQTEVDDAPMVGEQDTSPVALPYRANMEAFLFSYGDLSASLDSTIRMTESSAGYPVLQAGLFREFWKQLEKNFLAGAAENLEFQHARTERDESVRSETWEEMQDEFGDNIGRNQQDLNSSREKLRNLSNTMRATLRRSFISDFLARQKTSFEIQRLFVTTHIQLSKTVCAILNTVLDADTLEGAIDDLDRAADLIRGNVEMKDAAKTKLTEWFAEFTNKSGAEDFSGAVARLDRWVETISCRYETLIYLRFYLELHTHLLEVFQDLGEAFRLFSKQADHEIQNLDQEAREFQVNPGGKAQSEEYHNDIEALQGFDGHRMWDEFYDNFVKSSVDIRQEEIRQTIADIFADKRLTTPRDQIDQIRINFWAKVEEVLEKKIVGAYKTGKDKRGLTLQQALLAEAQLKYRERLKALGQWDDARENWEYIVLTPELKLHSRSQRELSKDMAKFNQNYLEAKISTCVRRSAIMANIDVEDQAVSEFACKQSLFCYDHELYGDQPSADSTALDFPHLIKRIGPEFINKDFTDQGKMVIFYQAVLGVPLFVFRNLMTTLKEAYNKRLGEREWGRPLHGRQYPLHIDKNWEQGDPGVDDSKLPLSIDPDEATISSRMTNEERCRFFAYWYALYTADHIIRDEDRGFMVPSGKLGNGGQDIILGQTVREAIQAMMKAHSAHETLERAFQEANPLEQKKLQAQRDEYLSQLGGDVWGNEEQDPDIKELADLLQEYLEFEKLQQLERERRENRRRAYDDGFGKKS